MFEMSLHTPDGEMLFPRRRCAWEPRPEGDAFHGNVVATWRVSDLVARHLRGAWIEGAIGRLWIRGWYSSPHAIFQSPTAISLAAGTITVSLPFKLEKGEI